MDKGEFPVYSFIILCYDIGIISSKSKGYQGEKSTAPSSKWEKAHDSQKAENLSQGDDAA